MKQIFAILFVITISSIANAQLSLQYTNTRQAPASHNMTILDQKADDFGNIYIVYSDDPAKILLLSKISISGVTLWTDTVSLPSFQQVDVTKAKVNLGQNKLYVLFPGFGNPSPAGAIVAIYDFNGNYLNGFNASTMTNIWSYGVHGIHEKINGNIVVYYSYGDQFTANDTMYVKEFNPNFSLVWSVKYSVEKLSWHCPNYIDNNGNFYFTYNSDSISGAVHYLKSYTRKVDNAGNLIWTNVIPDVANKLIQKMYNGDIVLTGNNNPNGSILGNNTGDIRTSRVSDANGVSSWTQLYNGPNNDRDEVHSVTVNQLNEVFIAGTEDLSKGFFRKYDQTGVLQYEKLMPINSGTLGVYLSMLGNIHTISILNGNIHIKKILATTGSTIDSMTAVVSFPIGMSGNTSNVGDDLFFTYSEGHCGANHLEVLRFCTKAICTPETISDAAGLNSKLTVYPNPASTLLYLKGFTDEQCSNMHILSVTGERMAVRSDAGQVDISCLAAGMYILSYNFNKKTEYIRFVKE